MLRHFKKFILIFNIFFHSQFVFSKIEKNTLEVDKSKFSEAIVKNHLNSQVLEAETQDDGFSKGEIVGVMSQDPKIGIIAFLEITDIIRNENRFKIKLKLLRSSKFNFVQKGDRIIQLNLQTEDPIYIGTTDLIVKKSEQFISARYKSLFTQGPTIGETAQTLWQNESILTVYGLYYYGLTDYLTMGLFLPNLFFGSFNWTMKSKLIESDANIISAGLTYIKVPQQNYSTLNLNFYWDSIGNESTLSHTFFSLAVLTWDGAIDTSAIKSAGTSSLQTGYEFILSDWNRLLIGPSYNFEKKSIGGYMSYVHIWDKFHLQWGLGATNLSQFTSDPRNGYYLMFDSYWRF